MQATEQLKKKKRTGIRARDLAAAGMLSAVAFVLMFLDFPIPMLIPPFVKMDFSDLPALLGAFSLGPVYGVVISLVKNLLHILAPGTTTACAGELGNFLMGAVFAYTAGWMYRRNKSRKGALIAALTGAVVMGIASVPINYFITYPAYIKFYGLPEPAIMEMYRMILPGVKDLISCLWIFNAPFTLMKGLFDVVLCFLIYKPLSPILHGKH